MVDYSFSVDELMALWSEESEAYKACYPRLGLRFEFDEETADQET